MTRETWLNGWHRRQGGVLIGATVHCAGCGKEQGVTCISLTGNETWPDKTPDWPFNEFDCPVHNFREEPQPVDRLAERAKALKSRK